MAHRTQGCNLKISIKETLSLSKPRELVTENILLLKYQKQAIAVVLNRRYNQSRINNNTLMLSSTALRKSWICQMLPFIVSRGISPIGNKVPDQKFFFKQVKIQ